MENLTSIGEKIKNKRLELNLRMDDVAKMSGTNRSTLWSIENGKGNYSVSLLLSVLKALNLSIDVSGDYKIGKIRKRATRTNTIKDKRINRFIIMCVEQYARWKKIDSKSAYNLMSNSGVIQELTDDYEDMHGMSTEYINDYIDKRAK